MQARGGSIDERSVSAGLSGRTVAKYPTVQLLKM
jgi:hypothetical protein